MPHGPASVYIKDAKFMLTVDPQRRLLDDTSLAVSGDRIAAIGPNAELEKEWVGPQTRVIDGSQRFVTPGLINSHIHLESCYDKGLLDDVPVVPWCERYFSYTYGTLTDESYYYAALVSLLACLKTGTTTVSDCGTIQTMEGSPVKALTDIGMRGVLARDLMDVHTATKSDYASYDAFTDLLDRLQETTDQCLERSEKFINDYNGAADGRVRTWLDLQQVCNCSPELCKGVKKLADGYEVGVQTHAAVSHDMVEMTRKRFGMRDIEYLHANGVLGRNFLAAHMAWTDASELIALYETDSNVVHVPGSSLPRRLLGGFEPREDPGVRQGGYQRRDRQRRVLHRDLPRPGARHVHRLDRARRGSPPYDLPRSRPVHAQERRRDAKGGRDGHDRRCARAELGGRDRLA